MSIANLLLPELGIAPKDGPGFPGCTTEKPATLLAEFVHHRAQLGVHLRLVDVPVPQMYGRRRTRSRSGRRAVLEQSHHPGIITGCRTHVLVPEETP